MVSARGEAAAARKEVICARGRWVAVREDAVVAREQAVGERREWATAMKDMDGRLGASTEETTTAITNMKTDNEILVEVSQRLEGGHGWLGLMLEVGSHREN